MNLSIRLFGRSFVALAIALQPTLAAAQVAQRAPFAIGQPPRWLPHVDLLGVHDRASDGLGGALLAGVDRPFFNPLNGVLSGAAEAYAIAGGAFEGGGARVLAHVPMLALGAGADWNGGRGRAGRVDFLLSYRSAIRRGGLLGRGTMLRVDWLPTRGRTLAVGVHVPVLQPLAGRTRARRSAVPLPRPAGGELAAAAPPSSASEALAAVADAALTIAAYGSLWSEASVRRARTQPSHAAALRAYDAALARAFGQAAGDSATGAAVTARARAGLLDAVIVPYDRLFGQAKEPARSIRGLTADAQARFAAWLRDSSSVAPAARGAVLATHGAWLGAVEAAHRELARQHGDSRYVWLPFRLALVPEQFDEQEEVDSLVARVVERPFTDGNALTYLRSADIPLEVARSIYAARDYHVLWMHDFTGRREGTGTVDNVAYEMVADAYLPALTAAVKRYDATGTLPAYVILLDQFFYEPRDGRLWMTMLEDPLRASMRLPRGNAAREAHLRERQAELRAAVAASARLQRDAARSGGDAWLRRVVRVQVNVTQPSDFSFRSRRIVPGIPFTPDNVMRDHRKIALYDLREDDPYRGSLLLMGVGVGEHYASDTWEDRGLRLRGPAALEGREALRRELRRNGFADADIPPPLRASTSAHRVELRTDRGDYVGRALQVHNEVGFGAKRSSAARALLYDLAEPGSVIVAPDPLWLSAEWGSMLAGAAARGVRVYVVAPALENAPSPQGPLMATAHDVMGRLLELRQALAPSLRESGGDLRVGIFAARAPVNDVQGRRREVREGVRRAPWLREVFPFDAATLAVLDRAEARVSTGADATEIAHDESARPPQLHQKTQLLARPGAIAALLRQPGWDDILASAMSLQSAQTARFAEQLGYETPALDTTALRRTDVMVRGYEQAIPEAERKRFSFYFMVGTQNADPRGLASDGEATIVTSGFPGAVGLVDLYYVMARSTWITTSAELDRLIPPQSRLTRWLARLVRPTL